MNIENCRMYFILRLFYKDSNSDVIITELYNIFQKGIIIKYTAIIYVNNIN